MCVCGCKCLCEWGGVRVYVCECVVNFKMYLHSRSLVLFHFLLPTHRRTHNKFGSWAEGEGGKAVRVAYVGAELA